MRFSLPRWFVGCLSLACLNGVSGCTQSSAPVAESRALPEAIASESASAVEARAPGAPPAMQTEEVAATDREATAVEPETTSAPQRRETAKPIIGEYGANVPPVLLSSGHAKLCKVSVGDEFPAMQLPPLTGGGSAEIAYGAKATVVLFWTTDRWMSVSALRDLVAISPEGVSIVGVAVGTKPDAAGNVIAETGAKFTQLLDANGAAFSQLGESALPRVYVLDAQHHIAWFDIEYSEATHRELQQTLAALAGR
jgi:peroxiredoxin